MTQLTIDTSKNRVYLLDNLLEEGKKPVEYDLGSIVCAFGNIVCCLEEIFGKDNYTSTDYVVSTIWGKEHGSLFNPDPAKVFGFPVRSSTLTVIYSFLSDKEFLETEISFEDIERMRIYHGYKVYPKPIDPMNKEKGLVFDVGNLNDVVFSILYYYVVDKFKVRKCCHCGRIFATKSLKIKYCPRKSTSKKYKHLECKDAADYWKKKLREREKSVRSNWEYYYPEKVNDLINTCNHHLKDLPLSIENLTACEEYLYSDNMPKQTRPNRKKRSE